MARKRDYKAEYRARVERGRQLGLTTSQSTGKAGRARVASVTELRARGVLPERPTRPPRTLTSVRVGGTTAHRTGSKATVEALVRQAARKGESVSFRVTAAVGDKGWRTMRLGVDGGEGSAAFLAGDAGPAPFQSIEPGRSYLGKLDTPTTRQASSKAAVEVRVGGEGVPASVVLAAWDAYDDGDYWDFLADWAEWADWDLYG